MHYHCEIILAPTDDIEAAVASVMKPFDESPEGADEDYDPRHAFWDWYVIGGRWAGDKEMMRRDEEQVAAFCQWLRDEKVTVSGFTCGKQTLEPASQREKVDAKWTEMFHPGSVVIVACPIFDHSSSQYAKGLEGVLEGDILPLAESLHATCERVIFTGPGWNYDEDTKTGKNDGPPEAKYMLTKDAWNGTNHMPVAWDGALGSALEMYRADLARKADHYRELMEPQDDWLAVTVDYHS